MFAMLTFYRWMIGRGSYATITGKAFRPRPMDMGRLVWLLFAVCCLYVALAVVLPVAALVFTSGWISNLAAISTIATILPDCLIMSDALNHN